MAGEQGALPARLGAGTGQGGTGHLHLGFQAAHLGGGDALAGRQGAGFLQTPAGVRQGGFRLGGGGAGAFQGQAIQLRIQLQQHVALFHAVAQVHIKGGHQAGHRSGKQGGALGRQGTGERQTLFKLAGFHRHQRHRLPGCRRLECEQRQHPGQPEK